MMVAEGYDDLMSDLLMTMLHIRNLMDIDRTEYDAVMTRYDSNLDREGQPQTQRSSEWSCFGVFRCLIDYGLHFVFGPQPHSPHYLHPIPLHPLHPNPPHPLHPIPAHHRPIPPVSNRHLRAIPHIAMP